MPTDARMEKIDDLLIKMGHLTTKVKQFINVVLGCFNAFKISVFLFGTDSLSSSLFKIIFVRLLQWFCM